MTKEKAIRVIKDLMLKIEPPTDTQLGWLETWVTKEDIQGLRMAINILETLPSEAATEQETVKSYFERLKQVMKERNEDNGGEPLNGIDKGYDLAFKHMCLEMDKILLELAESEANNGNDN